MGIYLYIKFLVNVLSLLTYLSLGSASYFFELRFLFSILYFFFRHFIQIIQIKKVNKSMEIQNMRIQFFKLLFLSSLNLMLIYTSFSSKLRILIITIPFLFLNSGTTIEPFVVENLI